MHIFKLIYVNLYYKFLTSEIVCFLIYTRIRDINTYFFLQNSFFPPSLIEKNHQNALTRDLQFRVYIERNTFIAGFSE